MLFRSKGFDMQGKLQTPEAKDLDFPHTSTYKVNVPQDMDKMKPFEDRIAIVHIRLKWGFRQYQYRSLFDAQINFW